MPKLRIRDIDLYYETTGQGETILFLHSRHARRTATAIQRGADGVPVEADMNYVRRAYGPA
jgi:recombinational DNA repair protein RecR